MKVLIGVDGSPGSYAAIRLIGSLLDYRKDEVLLYYSPPQLGDVSSNVTTYVCDAVMNQARRYLPASFQETATVLIGVQRPDHGLLVAADECRADVIGVGARGTGPLTAPTLGSVARNIVQHATVPVFIVRGVQDRLGGTPLKVLWANDGGAVGQHAEEVLGRFSFPPDSVGKSITVVERPTAGHVPPWLAEQLDDEQLAQLGLGAFEPSEETHARVRAELSRQSVCLPAIFKGQRPLIAVGHAGQEILKAIDKEHIDLVVLGARRLGTIGRFLLGSTSQHIVSQAPCSVLVVRSHERP
jgi:nucleotide-binding universal stress UspA family protein